MEDTKDTTCISILNHDAANGDMVSCSIYQDGSNGRATMTKDTCVEYLPNLTFNGRDTVIKIACDNAGLCDTLVLVYVVVPENDPPIIIDPTTGNPADTLYVTLDEDSNDTTCVSIINDDIANGDMITCSIFSDGINGTVSMTSDTCIAYLPNANVNGKDTIIKIACDLGGLCDTVVIVYTITPVDDTPIIIDPSTGNPTDTLKIILDEDTQDTTCVSVINNDGLNGDMITCSIFSDGTNGTASITSDTCVAYVPNANFV